MIKKKLTILLIVFAAIVVSSCATAPPQESDLKKLQGRWAVSQEFYQGKDVTPEGSKPILTLDIGTWKVEDEGEVVAGGSYKINPTLTPKTIDYTVSVGEDSGKTFAAIYELSGDTFRHCGERNASRPQTFEAKPDTEIFLTTFQRTK